MAVQNFGSGGGTSISPGVNVSEIDLTTVVPSVATTVGAIAGVFRWGPVGERVLVTSENDLVARFGKPSNVNAETFFTAANFLGYSDSLYVSRAANTASVLSAIASVSAFAANAAHTIANSDDYDAKRANFNSAVEFIARCPGALGNSLKVSVCDSTRAFSSTINLPGNSTFDATGGSNTLFNSANTRLTINVGSNTATITLANTGALAGDTPVPFANNVAALFTRGDYIEVGNSTIGRQALKITNINTIVSTNTTGGNTGQARIVLSLDQPYKLSTNFETSTVTRNWEYFNSFDRAPGRTLYMSQSGNTVASDEVYVVVVDEDGEFTGSPGAILETYGNLSRATDAKSEDGAAIFYRTAINERSRYIWVASDLEGAPSTTAANLASSLNTRPSTISFQGGTDNDESTVPVAELARAYDLFASAEDIDISLILTGTSRGGVHGEQVPNYIIDNIAEVRKDCVVFISPQRADVVNNVGRAAVDVVEFRNALRSSSYAFLDSGYKYQYDKYNDVYRYVPLNGDIAGLCAFTDNARDPWYSPAGYNRGQIRNVIKLPFNPTKAERDLLYKNGVNPVISQTGQGTVLFGDKTLLGRPSAFDRINVRRLFIVLEKAISVAAQSLLFEFNDEFSRNQFRNLVEPYLRDVQGRRGIFDFRVVCDESNNTPEVIDANRFVGDIYVRPAKSINFIQLNFVAIRSGVEFSEIVGG